MNSIHKFLIAWTITAALTSTCVAATTLGSLGDGKISVVYDTATGNFSLRPDGVPGGIGLFQILSASGIFTSSATLPPGGLGFDVNTATEKAWAALPSSAVTTNFNLGNIAAPGLTWVFLLNDLTLTVSGGFGTENSFADLVLFNQTVPPVITPVNLGEVIRSTPILADIPFGPPSTWSGLTPVAGSPARPATLTPQGAFSWDPTGSARGPKGNGVLYSWSATVLTAFGSTTGVILTLRLIPEPTTVTLIGLAAMGLAGFLRRYRKTSASNNGGCAP